MLQNLQQKEHIIYVSEIFYNEGDVFFIEEKFQTRLSDYLSKKIKIGSGETEKILKDIYQGICDIY